MINLLLTEIEWDAPEVLALSLPQKVLILSCPEGASEDDIQRLMKESFGVETLGYVGYVAEGRLRTMPRITAEVVVWKWNIEENKSKIGPTLV